MHAVEEETHRMAVRDRRSRFFLLPFPVASGSPAGDGSFSQRHGGVLASLHPTSRFGTVDSAQSTEEEEAAHGCRL